MLKRIFIILGLVVLIFVFGFWAEKEIKKINFQKIENIIVVPTPTGVTGSREKARVVKVIDGDTIELSDKRKVRYIGINSYEINNDRNEFRCLAEKSKEANQKLVENKEVELERDVSETDRYGRLLRYVWIDNLMLNNELVKNGWAEVSSYPPDIKYQDVFLESQNKAKLDKIGIWGETCQ